MSRPIKYCVYQESPYYVAQCLNVDVSSFGESIDEAVSNLKEAVELYFEDSDAVDYQEIGDALIGEGIING